MSSQNVELVRQGYEHYARTGTPPEWLWDPNIEWHSAADLPDSDVYRGVVAVREFMAEWPSAFEDFRGDIQEISDEGEYVVASLVMRGRIRGTGEEVSLPETHVFKIQDGKVTEVREYRTTEAALEAVRQAG